MSSTTDKRGGRRSGAGRPGMFKGPRSKVTVKLTDEARAAVKVTQASLTDDGRSHVSEGAAVEYLIRSATGLSTVESEE